ncbi:hypothetical protein F8154_02760 [Alkaliphilus pronyensis]|uniref:Uncharacterized protein n=1 Tax=Alkaliphilus pronyensis TaxID=1482732 RepID=A0A6I0FG70_9FIRM|nr:DUF5702 domain-containing protein [Alkaliphilus pronyensis]KAB3537233.1 hypothetical protein F8154_02760 [Alkaliphilus pronyensis]
MEGNNQRGAITVFLSIVLLVFIILAGVIVEAARLRVSEFQAKRITRLATNSVLAGYNKDLKEDYGLFALDYQNQDEITTALQYYINNNFKVIEGLPNIMGNQFIDSNSSTNYWDIFDYRIETVSVVPEYPLLEDEVIRQQILEFMKLRGPEKVVEVFLDKLLEFNNHKKSIKSFSQKLDIEEELYQLAILHDTLEDITDKCNEIMDGYIVAFTKDYVRLAEDLYEYQKEKESLNRRIDDLLKKSKNSNDIEIDNQLESLLQRLSRVSNEIRDIKKDISKIERQIEAEILSFEGLNNEAVSIVDLITAKNEAIKTLIDNFENEIKGGENQLNDELKEDIKEFKKIIQEAKVQSIKDSSLININNLMRAQLALEKLTGNRNPSSQKDMILIKEKAKEIQLLIESCIKLEFTKVKVEYIDNEGVKVVDDRRRNASKAKEFLLEEKETIKKTIDADVFKNLPSKGENNTYINKEIEFDGNSGKGGYTFESYNLLNSLMFDSFKEDFVNIRDEIYINEYILGMFKSYVSDKESFIKDLRNIEKPTKSTFLDYEVEYILYGSDSQAENFNKAKRDILAMRFVFNVLHVYQTPKLVNDATIIAASLSSILGGASLPLLKTLILCGWAMSYSIEDVSNLLKGEEVNLIKKTDTIKLNYEDYLRILLLKPGIGKIKLNRVKDLIQLNINKKTGEALVVDEMFTYMNVNIKYSIKYLFFNLPLFQRLVAANDNRYNYEIQLWYGY